MLVSRLLTIFYLTLLAGSPFLPLGSPNIATIWIVSTVIYIGISAWGSSQIGSQYYLSTYCKNSAVQDRVALTFDDGPDGGNTSDLLELLAEFNVKATFFVIGKKIEERGDLVGRMHREGHLIGNHSYTHSNLFPLFPVRRIEQEIRDTQKAIKEITGRDNLFFRPPFGVTNPLIAKALKNLPLQSVGWSIRSMDTRISKKQKVLNRIVSKVKGGDIILLHDKTPDIVWIVRKLLEFLSTKQLLPVTVAELQIIVK